MPQRPRRARARALLFARDTLCQKRATIEDVRKVARGRAGVRATIR